MAMESISTQMVPDMKVIGLLINKKDKVLKLGLMEQHMKGNTKKVIKMA